MDIHEGFCVRRTMDSGYIFSGWTGYWMEPGPNNPNAQVLQVETDNTQDAWLVRYSEEGEYLWGIAEERGVDYHYYSVVQLPDGGYVAGGCWTDNGYLVRYAPETGIEVSGPLSAVSLEVSPNPFSSTLSIALSLPEATEVCITAFDLNGRIVDTVENGFHQQGASTVEWVPSSSLSSGCYLLNLEAGDESATVNCVLIR
ncbi:MAG: T9SS type A sorting domain-containing protein, partial [Candidatus Fermentibacteraceae bacterium]|nr:T9SS type A sorting domain-containing protein [Candidatus Fermentibacteraceae bacterium]